MKNIGRELLCLVLAAVVWVLWSKMILNIPIKNGVPTLFIGGVVILLQGLILKE